MKRLFDMKITLSKPTIADLSVFVLTFFSIDTLLFGTNRDGKWQYILVISLLLFEGFMLIKLFKREKYKLSVRSETMHVTLAFILLVIFTQISASIRGSYNTEIQYFYHIIQFTVLLTTVQFVSAEEFVESYIKIMCVFAVFACVLFVFDRLKIYRYLPSYRMVNTAGHVFSHFGLGAIAEPREYVPARVYGIFREPGVMAVYTCVGVYFELFIKQNVNLKRVILLSAVSVLTFSTAGYIALGAYLILYVVMKTSNSAKERLGKTGLFLGGIIFVVFVLDEEIVHQVFGKLFVENDSLNSRVYSIIGGFTYSLGAPLFGLGWGEVISNFGTYMYSEYELLNISFTNTYLRMACTYGWIFTFVAVIGVLKYNQRAVKNRALAISLFCCWLIIMSNENFILNYLVYIVVYYGLAEKNPWRGSANNEGFRN